MKLSPSAMARTGASSRVRVAMLPSSPCASTSVTRPAFAPLVQVKVPEVNQPASNPDSPEAMNARSRNRSVTTPVPL